MNIKLLGTKVLLKIEKGEEAKKGDLEKSKGGIFIPQGSNIEEEDTVNSSIALKVGTKCETVKEGDLVYFDGRMAIQLVIAGERCIMINEDAILGVKST